MRFRSVFLRALLITVASALMGAPALAQSPLKIGFVAELSGPQAALGQDQYDGFMLFLEQHGGRLGNLPVQVLREDTQLRPEVAVQIVQRLIERDRVPIITGVTFSNVMMAIHKPVTERKVFLISSLAGPSPIAGAQCSPYQFITSFQLDVAAEAHAHYANEKGYKRIFLLAPNYQAGKDFLAGFRRVFKGEVVDEVYTAMNAPDFSAELTQVAAARPDAVFAFYPGALGINFVRQYSQMGLLKTTPLLSQGAVDGSTLPALGDAALGALNGAPWGPDLENVANRNFVQAFEEKYKRIPTLFAAQSYDAAQLLDSALRRVMGNVEDKEALRLALKAAEFPSVRGNFRFGNNQFPIQDYFIQQVVKDARGRVTLRTVATPLKNHADSYAVRCPMK
ncbi:MAG: ABC transporter substrate-binding protein [Burkholderiaceae bacterium]|nr:ABC transporter substrate-binding protein [Burkholderiaceae bacterium]